MAAGLLEKLLDKSVSPNELIKSFIHNDNGESNRLLKEHSVSRSEFVPYFISFLQEQASALLRVSKTPVSFSYASSNRGQQRSTNKTPVSSAGRRVQLFSHKNKSSSFETSSHQLCRTKFDSSPSSEFDLKCSSSGKADRQRYNLGDFMSPSNDGGTCNRNNVNKEYLSPVNSNERLNSKCDRTMTRNRISGKMKVQNEPVFSLTSADDFPEMVNVKEKTPRPSAKQKASRRIMPTLVLHTKSTDEKKLDIENVFDDATFIPAPANVMPRSVWAKPPPDVTTSLNRSASILDSDSTLQGIDKLTKLSLVNEKIVVEEEEYNGNFITPKKSTLVHIHANLDDVTYVQELEILSNFYSSCIKEGLVANVVKEIHFVVQLLTVKYIHNPGKDDIVNEFSNSIGYFATIHNAVFFATKTLTSLHSYLSFLDHLTIKLLVNNICVTQFAPELLLLLNSCEQPIRQVSHSLSCFSPLSGVSFQVEKDNKQNFPNDRSFHLFKKQRDTFYELFRDWEENHLSAGWTMKEMQANKIHWLMNGCQPQLVNYIHLVRLFVLQLIKTCGAEGNLLTEEKDANLCEELKQANPDKLKRLQERLINPTSTACVLGICPYPSFPGFQEFFRDFISISSNQIFNQHFTESLVDKINELIENSETRNKLELRDESSTEEKHDELLHNLVMLRILGKFLGYVTFLPYRSCDTLTESIKNVTIKARNQVKQSIDIMSFLKEEEEEEERLFFNLIWIIDYLTMMDTNGHEIVYYQLVFARLVHIYCDYCRFIAENQRHSSLFLIVTALGWFFDLKIFPETEFYKRTNEKTFKLTTTNSESMNVNSLIDQRILYTCCPHLVEIRNFLLDYSLELNSNNTSIRKITPTKAKPIENYSDSNLNKNVQHQLEENFFQMHPDSLRHTVVFIASRVSSNCIKTFQAKRLIIWLEIGKTRAKEQIQVEEERNVQLIEDIAENLLQNLMTDEKRWTECYCKEKVESLISNLLPEEMSTAVINVANNISFNMANKKVATWLINNITTNFLLKEFLPAFEKETHNSSLISSIDQQTLTSDLQPPFCQTFMNGEHMTSSFSPSELIFNMKNVLRDLLLIEEKSLNDIQLNSLIESIKHVISYQQDLLPLVANHIAMLSVSLACNTVFFRPDLWSDFIESHLVTIWKMLKCECYLKNITSIKHKHSLQKSSNKSREKFRAFVKLLMKEKLLSSDKIDLSIIE